MRLRAARHGSAVFLSVLVGLQAQAAGEVRGQRASRPAAVVLADEEPRYGVYFHRPEPAFYTGFAPRCQEPRRIHLHVGRGNQLRVTVTLSDEMLRLYARDLLERVRSYRQHIDSGQLVLTQNLAFEEFERTLAAAQVEQLVAEEPALDAGTLRERNLELLSQLNPGRVFRIRMPLDEVLRRWIAEVRAGDRRQMHLRRRIELANLLLPTRLHVAELTDEAAAELEALVRLCPARPDGAVLPGELEALRAPYIRLLYRLSGSLYPVRNGHFTFDEFTAVYPIGTFKETIRHRGRRIPFYPTPGRRALTTHQRTRTIDHIAPAAIFSYFPWIPYMHVGRRLHNSFHTLWWRLDTGRTRFLPAAWRDVRAGSRDGSAFPYLWLLSRGPMSNGCTHLNAGHISELRQILPSAPERLARVDTFYNPSHLYDVFDVDGDLTPEVMGVRYFVAYSLRAKRPDRLRVRGEREEFYDWLYAGELGYAPGGAGTFAEAQDGLYIQRDVLEGRVWQGLELYEAAYEPERIQFYRLVDIPFARELRKVGVQP